MALGREFLATFRSVGADKLAGDFTKVARGTEQLDKGLKKSGDNSVRAQRRFSELGATIGSLAKVTAGLAIGKFLADSAMGAARMETNLSNVSAILGDVAATNISEWAKDNAAALNLSQVAASDAARMLSTYAAEVQQAGGDSVQFTTDMTRLAAEVASFSSRDPSTVIEAFTGAMRGEFDTLQGMGVNINAALINQKALQMGLAATTQELTTQDKTLATYMTLLDLGGKFMGTTARNADSLTVQMADLKQQVADLGTEIGRTLVPTLSAAAAGFTTLLGAFSALPGPVRAFILVLTGVMVVSRLLGPAITKIGIAFAALRAEMAATASAGAKFGVAMNAMKSAFNPWILGITAVITVLTLWIQKSKEAKQRAEEWASGIDVATGALNQAGQEKLVKSLADYVDEAKEAGISTKELAAVAGDTKGYEALIAKLQEVADAHSTSVAVGGRGGVYSVTKIYDAEGQAAVDLIGNLSDLRKEYTDGKELAKAIAEAQAGVTDAFGETGDAVDLLAQLFDHLRRNVRDASEEFDDFIDKFSILNQEFIDSKSSVYDYGAAVDDLAESLVKGGGTFSPDLEAGRENWDNFVKLAEASSDRVATVLENKGPKAAMRLYDELRQQMIDMQTQAGVPAAEARRRVDEQFKKPVAIKIMLDKGAILKYNEDLAKLRQQKAQIQAEFDPTKFGSADAAERAGQQLNEALAPVQAKIDAKVEGKHAAKQDLDDITQPNDPRVAGINLKFTPELATVETDLTNLTRDRWINLYVNPPTGATSGGGLEGLLGGPLSLEPSASSGPRGGRGQPGSAPAPTPVTPRRDNVTVNVHVDGRKIESTATVSRGRGRGRAA